jgi:DNA-directed RNA polymerase specialized sigma24 family protein
MKFALDVIPETFSQDLPRPSTWRGKARALLHGKLKLSKASQMPAFADTRVLRILETVAGLPRLSRSIFILRVVEDLVPSIIASITSLPLDTVHSHLYSALAAVQHVVQAPEG